MNKLAGNNLDLDKLKLENPKEYFGVILDEKDYEELCRLNEETGGKIDWDTLVQDGVCEIINGKLISIDWPKNLILNRQPIKDLGKIKNVRGNLDLRWSSVVSLGILEEVGGNLNLHGTIIKTLGNLKKIVGNLNVEKGNLSDLGELKEVGGDFNMNTEKILSLGKLEKVGGQLFIINTKLAGTGNLRQVGGMLYIRGTNQDFKMEVIEKTNNGSIEVIGNIYYGIVKELKMFEFEEFNGSLDLKGENIDDFGILKKFNGDLLLQYSRISNLGNIEEVTGNLLIIYTNISGVGKLKKVGGDFDLEGTDFDFQLEVLEKIFDGTLIVEGNISFDSELDIEKYFENNSLKLDICERDFGTDVNQINDKDMKIRFSRMLKLEYRISLRRIFKNVINIKTQGQLEEFDNQIKMLKKRISGYGIDISEIDINDIIK